LCTAFDRFVLLFVGFVTADAASTKLDGG
jgi:hypothetical protein